MTTRTAMLRHPIKLVYRKEVIEEVTVLREEPGWVIAHVRLDPPRADLVELRVPTSNIKGTFGKADANRFGVPIAAGAVPREPGESAGATEGTEGVARVRKKGRNT